MVCSAPPPPRPLRSPVQISHPTRPINAPVPTVLAGNKRRQVQLPPLPARNSQSLGPEIYSTIPSFLVGLFMLLHAVTPYFTLQFPLSLLRGTQRAKPARLHKATALGNM